MHHAPRIDIELADARGDLPPGWRRVTPAPGQSVRIDPVHRVGPLHPDDAPWTLSLTGVGFGGPVDAWDWVAAAPVTPDHDPQTGRVWLETGGVVLVLTTPTPAGG